VVGKHATVQPVRNGAPAAVCLVDSHRKQGSLYPSERSEARNNEGGPTILGTILLVVGSFWAIIGFANCGGMFSQPDIGSGVATFGLIFNTVLFVLPGLICAGVGQHLRTKAATSATQPLREPARPSLPEFVCPRCRGGVDPRAVVCPNCRSEMLPIRRDDPAPGVSQPRSATAEEIAARPPARQRRWH
jgi:hypothetical protein